MKPQQNQEKVQKSPFKLFFDLYDKKYIPTSSLPAEKQRKIQRDKSLSHPETIQSHFSKTSTLLPKLNDLEVLGKSSKKKQQKGINLMSNLDVYFAKKNVAKEQSYNLLFLTDNAPSTNGVISDKELNKKFQNMFNKHRFSTNQIFQTLLARHSPMGFTNEEKKTLILKKKQELEGVITHMLQQNQVNMHVDEKLQKTKTENKNTTPEQIPHFQQASVSQYFSEMVKSQPFEEKNFRKSRDNLLTQIIVECDSMRKSRDFNIKKHRSLPKFKRKI